MRKRHSWSLRADRRRSRVGKARSQGGRAPRLQKRYGASRQSRVFGTELFRSRRTLTTRVRVARVDRGSRQENPARPGKNVRGNTSMLATVERVRGGKQHVSERVAQGRALVLRSPRH